MTALSAAHQASAAETPTITLPNPNTVIVPGQVVFADDVWDITALSGRLHVNWLRIKFETIPVALRADVKHFLYLLLTVDTPMDRLDRPVSTRARVTPSTVKAVWEDLKPFLAWFSQTGRSVFADLDDRDLRDYARYVQQLPVIQPVRGRRLFAVTKLWLYAPYLRPTARLVQPFWEREGVDEVLGPSEWTPDNKTPPVHPATMSALLVWCLRVIEDAPVLAQVHSLSGTAAVPLANVADQMRWVGAGTARRPFPSRRLVSTAALILVSYLTGMRADEVLSLRRGCCTARVGGGYEIRGQTFKAAVADGRSIPAGVEREQPWLAIKPVADAIAVMESLHPSELIFPGGMLRQSPQLPLIAAAPDSRERASSIGALLRWSNRRAAELGRLEDAIPDDPDGPINLRRLRRTLAWFIYRRPRGRVALGIQYGHLHAATTDGYGSRASVGLRDLFPMEEALAIGDTLTAAAEQLELSPAVSGPAADRYRLAATEFSHRYGGMALTARQAADLAANPDLRIYDGPGQTLACCFDPRKALCRRATPQSKASSTPDLTACDSRCANIARTDHHIELITAEIHHLRDEIVSPVTPEPIKPRLELRVERHQAIVDAHHKETHRD